MPLSYLLPLVIILLDSGCRVDLVVVLADCQVILVVQVQINHLAVVPHLQLICILSGER